MSAWLRFPEFTIKWVTLPWERQQAMALRRKVFCHEQSLFADSDEDEIDARAILLVAVGAWGGWHEKVVGTVRIHRETHQGQPAWYGSRLAVDPAYRREGLLGPTLIRLAVSSARGLGCSLFLANVQAQNEKLFARLHWKTIGRSHVQGREHAFMEAQLAHYPPCSDPTSGFVVRARPAVRQPLSLEFLEGASLAPSAKAPAA